MPNATTAFPECYPGLFGHRNIHSDVSVVAPRKLTPQLAERQIRLSPAKLSMALLQSIVLLAPSPIEEWVRKALQFETFQIHEDIQRDLIARFAAKSSLLCCSFVADFLG